jgi:hypothetical protein
MRVLSEISGVIRSRIHGLKTLDNELFLSKVLIMGAGGPNGHEVT